MHAHVHARACPQVRDLRKVYPGQDGGKRKLAVRTLTLAIERGECFGLLGPNVSTAAAAECCRVQVLRLGGDGRTWRGWWGGGAHKAAIAPRPIAAARHPFATHHLI